MCCTLIEKGHLGAWSPEKDCCLWLTFRQPVRKPSSEWNHLTLKMASAQVVETIVANNSPYQTPITEMIFFNQGMLLLGSNHFLKMCCVKVYLHCCFNTKSTPSNKSRGKTSTTFETWWCCSGKNHNQLLPPCGCQRVDSRQKIIAVKFA